MNILTGVIAIILIGSAAAGWKKGLVKVLFSLAAAIFTLVIVMALQRPASAWLRENTGLYGWLEQGITGFVRERVDAAGVSAGSSLTRQIQALGLPEILTEGILIEAAGQGVALSAGVTETIASALTELVFSVLSWLILFAAVRILVAVAGAVLGVLTRLPVLRQVNAAAGAAAGLLLGLGGPGCRRSLLLIPLLRLLGLYWRYWRLSGSFRLGGTWRARCRRGILWSIDLLRVKILVHNK